LIFERYLDFIRASVENPADSPIIRFTISSAAGRMSSSSIVWGSLHFAILHVCATLYNGSKALLGIDAYKKYPFVDITLLDYCWSSSEI